MGRRRREIISDSNLPELLPHPGEGALFQLLCKPRVYLWITGIIVGMCVTLPSALAEIEAAPNQDETAGEYIQSIVRHRSVIRLVISGFNEFADDITGEYYYPALNNTNQDGESTQSNANTATSSDYRFGPTDRFGDALAPESVWSLDVSTGIHVDQLSKESAPQLEAVIGGRQTGIGLWTRDIAGYFLDDDNNVSLKIFLSSALQLQVASCGNFAEYRNLDYCDSNHIHTSQDNDNLSEKIQANSSDMVVTSNGNVDVALSSNTTSTSAQGSGPNAIQDLSPLLPVGVSNFTQQGDLTALSTLLDEWWRFADNMNWPTAPTDAPTGPIEYPTAPIDPSTPPDPPPPDPIISVGDPGSVLDPLPIPTPPLAATTVPETSTWVMIMIGFGFIVVAHRGGFFHSIKQAAVATLSRITKRYIGHYTA